MNKSFKKYSLLLDKPELSNILVVQILNWIGNFNQSSLGLFLENNIEHIDFRPFLNFVKNNNLIALENMESPVSREICLLVKVSAYRDYKDAVDYINSKIELFPTILNNPDLLLRKDKSDFFKKIKNKINKNAKLIDLENFALSNDGFIFGIDSIEKVALTANLDLSFVKKLQKEKEDIILSENKSQFLLLIEKTFQDSQSIDIEMIDDFILSNAFEISQFLGFMANRGNLIKYLNLSEEHFLKLKNKQDDKLKLLKNRLQEEKEFVQKEKEKEAFLKSWRKTLIHATDIPKYFGITILQFKKWRDDGRIPVAENADFRKWGKYLTTSKHDPKQMEHITPELIKEWIELDNLTKIKKVRIVSDSTKEKAKATRNWNKQIKSLIQEGFTVSENKKNVSKSLFLNFSFEGDSFSQNFIYTIPVNTVAKNLENGLIDFVQSKYEKITSDMLADLLSKKISLTLEQVINEALNTKEKIFLHESLSLFFVSNNNLNKLLNNNILFNKITSIYKEIASHRNQKIVRELLKLEDYQNNFPLARSMNRTIKIIVGPTNSGKTYEALETLKKAESGVYLAPLRLLAMEIYDKLNEAGIPCNLHTGEEHINMPGAKHTSSTIEMCNMILPVDVAIIDEFQMLKDQGRGWAWTAALTGVPAKQIFTVGSKESLSTTIELFKYLNESYEVIELERKTPLILAKNPTTLYDIKSNDVIVAFSRKNVLNIAAELRKLGHKVSVIYGALSPEVRRRQSELFLNGTHNVVVATDAIGMGLNLPAKRIIFSITSKFDGVSTRRLNVSEIKQIAGRAGRYGLYEFGEYTALSRNDLNYLKELENIDVDTSFCKMQIAPSMSHIYQLADYLKTDKLKAILYYFTQEIGIRNPLFINANLEDMLLLSQHVDQFGKKLTLEDKYSCVCAPVASSKEEEISYFKQAILSLNDKKEFSLFKLPGWINDFSSQHLQEAENFSKNLSLYSWLSYRFPNYFLDRDLIASYRTKLSNYIANALIKEKSSRFNWWD